MDPRHALVFVAVVEAGSFSGAARALGIAKSAVSRQVAQLEEDLGARLLHRTTRSLQLTDAGAALHGHAEQLAETLRDAERAVAELQSEPRGRLRLTAPVELAPLLAPLLTGFMQRYPRVQIEASLNSRVVDLVQEGFDVAIRGGAPGSESLIGKHLGPSRRALVASPSYLEAAGTPTDPEELREHEGLVYGGWGDFRFARDRHVAPRRRLVSDHHAVLVDAARAGLGVTQTIAVYARPFFASGELVRLLEEDEPEHQSLWIVYPSRRHLAPTVRVFIDELAPELRALADP